VLRGGDALPDPCAGSPRELPPSEQVGGLERCEEVEVQRGGRGDVPGAVQGAAAAAERVLVGGLRGER
jgi:hypothetical protein